MEIIILFALLSAVLRAANSLITRHAMRGLKDHWAFGMCIQTVLFLLFIPLMIVFSGYVSFTLTHESLLIALAICILWAVNIHLSYKAHKTIEVSDRAVLYRTKTIWVLFFSLAVLAESITAMEWIGIALIMVGTLAIALKGKRIDLSGEGGKITLANALIGALIGLLSKILLSYTDPITLSFITTAVPLLFIFMKAEKDKIERMSNVMRKYRFHIISAGLFIISADLIYLYSLSMERLSIIAPITSMSIIFVTIGGMIFLGEKKNMRKKVIGTITAFVGSFFV